MGYWDHELVMVYYEPGQLSLITWIQWHPHYPDKKS